MDMPFKYYHALYRAAWLESEQRAAEMEAEEQKQKQMEQQESRQQNSRGGQRLSQKEVLDRLHSMNSGALEEVIEDMT